MHICVGSLNPVKISAVKSAFNAYFNQFSLYKIDADSKIADQPIGKNKILEGALNRAKQALGYLKAEKNLPSSLFGIGIEAGLVKISLAHSNYMDFQFCVIIDEKNELTIGSGVGFEYPKGVIEKLFSEKLEIGEIMGNIANNTNLKNEKGAIGYLSNNKITRENILKQAVICALLPRINPKLYS
jgi:inosine/xanthosine triphosphatase